VLNSELSYLHN